MLHRSDWRWHPADREPIPVHGPPHRSNPARGALRVCSWNIQFAAGHDQLFFYDGGTAVSVPRPVVLRTLEGILADLQRIDADVLLLQEVDRGSRRTHFIDQHAWLAARLDHPYHASTPYHRVHFVPAPAHEMLGRVNMHLSIFSRHPLLPGTRVQLPLLREPWYRRHFNLRRALMEVPLVHEVGPAWLFHTHLSAFSRGDGTVPRQLARVAAELAAADQRGEPWLLAGDFNALPPGDDPARLGADASMYGAPSPLAPLYGRARCAVSARAHLDEPRRWRTWVPFRASAPQRALDHLFGSAGSTFSDVAVDRRAMGRSDHLPLVCTWDPSGAEAPTADPAGGSSRASNVSRPGSVHEGRRGSPHGAGSDE